ncbi:glutamate--tRNA ligase [Buchnera aphidicola]|uniref:glutamate--tRNA ligase n=1 Tax=Buchnera aphidicola TaxID=9 RepID=UPI0031B6B008
MKVRTRFAPSPTGFLHIGGARTALYSWLFAKKYKGSFILRIEDTDIKRLSSNAVKSIIDSLKWLGITWDEGPFFQIDKLSYYQNIIRSMISNGQAYKCYCSKERLENIRKLQISKNKKPKYDRKCRKNKIFYKKNQSYVVRFKNPLKGSVIVKDQIRGNIIFQNKELDDLVIQREDGLPTYNFCVVIDDRDMNITHIIRGEDHINNTPRQINIMNSLGINIPSYAHLSLIVDEKGKKISKRNNLVDVMSYHKKGYLPEALLNYMFRLGWSNGNREIFSIEEVKEVFDLKDISSSSSMFDMEKLSWYNRYYMKKISIDRLVLLLKNQFLIMNINIKFGPDLKELIKLLRFRFSTVKDMANECKIFYKENIILKDLNKQYIHLNTNAVVFCFYKKIKNIKSWDIESISFALKKVVEKFKINFKELAIPLRIILTGKENFFSINTIVFLLGKDVVLLRIKKGLNWISGTI